MLNSFLLYPRPGILQRGARGRVPVIQIEVRKDEAAGWAVAVGKAVLATCTEKQPADPMVKRPSGVSSATCVYGFYTQIERPDCIWFDRS
ncbi:hypothetical protein E2C01_015663 [Portunus trituberculatus]|uniref:Uncharacterized protein n=1 Tax=Portunus trituberculatus TaxID=210409 RepID=A0A5B7DNM7_PORTR|nr:hypothetical protein [Portunus trituberculatus]